MRHMIYYLTIILIYGIIFLCDMGISFNLEFTLTTISIYIISNYIYFKHKKEIVNFEFFFCLSFFVASFLAYFIIDIEGFAFFVFSTNPRSLVKGIALAMIGYHCYLCGLQPVNSNMKCYNEEGLRVLRMNSSSAKIGKNCVIRPGTLIASNLGSSNQKLRKVVVGDNVEFSAGCKILCKKIGNNVSVGPNAVVSKNVPDNSIVMGNPAEIVPKISF